MDANAPDAGSTTTQTVILFPALLFVVMLIFQFAMWRHAGHVVTAAAQHGAARAQAEGGSPGAAQEAGRDFLREAGTGLFDRVHVAATRDGNRARVTVRAQVVSLVPGWRPTVTGVADGPTERFRPPRER